MVVTSLSLHFLQSSDLPKNWDQSYWACRRQLNWKWCFTCRGVGLTELLLEWTFVVLLNTIIIFYVTLPFSCCLFYGQDDCRHSHQGGMFCGLQVIMLVFQAAAFSACTARTATTWRSMPLMKAGSRWQLLLLPRWGAEFWSIPSGKITDVFDRVWLFLLLLVLIILKGCVGWHIEWILSLL